MDTGMGKEKKNRKAGKEESSQNFMHSAVFKTKDFSIQRESQALKHFQRTSRYKTCFVAAQTWKNTEKKIAKAALPDCYNTPITRLNILFKSFL